MYNATANPVIASGDGVAMAYGQKTRIENMEFMQFHPATLYNPAVKIRRFLVSGAIRGHGGIPKTEEFALLIPQAFPGAQGHCHRGPSMQMKKKRGTDCMCTWIAAHLNAEDFIATSPAIHMKNAESIWFRSCWRL